MFARLLVLTGLILTPLYGRADEWISLFNGKDLTGWEGDLKLWSVKDGAITGTITKETLLKYNKFLIWKGQVENFELKIKFRMEGGNSGVQYRSTHLKNAGEFVVGGYQADIASGGFMGILYEERGRGILAQVGQKIIIDPKGDKYIVGSVGDPKDLQKGFDLKDWNEYRIVAKGNHLQQFINGKQWIDLIDLDEKKRALSGIVALQLHVGGTMLVQYKDVELKVLPTGGILTPEQALIPATAEKVGGKKK